MHLDAILEALPTFAAGGNSNNLKSSYRYLQKMKYLEKQNPKVSMNLRMDFMSYSPAAISRYITPSPGPSETGTKMWPRMSILIF